MRAHHHTYTYTRTQWYTQCITEKDGAFRPRPPPRAPTMQLALPVKTQMWPVCESLGRLPGESSGSPSMYSAVLSGCFAPELERDLYL